MRPVECENRGSAVNGSALWSLCFGFFSVLDIFFVQALTALTALDRLAHARTGGQTLQIKPATATVSALKS